MAGAGMSFRFATAAAALTALMAAGAPAAATATPTVGLKAVGQFSKPDFVTGAPGSPTLLFVVEQGGTVRVMRGGEKLGHPFLDIRSRVSSGGEQGLLSMAFDPRYEQNRRFYVLYTNRDCNQTTAGCNVEVDEFLRTAGSPARSREASRREIIEVNHHQSGYHNGGQLQFGPDGDLYLSIGDGGTQMDPENDAQNTENLLGKILRIDPRAGGGYDSPPTNPYVGVAGKDEIFSIGLRNPWRFSFDSVTGDMWIGDVGFDTWEEIDHETVADATGANFGWHVYEGPFPCGDCGFGPGTPPPPNYQPPVHSYSHPGGPGTEHGEVIIGGYVLHDPSLSALDGDYVYTDNEEGDLRAYDPGSDTEFGLGASLPSPTSFGEGSHHRLYVASGNYFGNGRVYRLVAP